MGTKSLSRRAAQALGSALVLLVLLAARVESIGSNHLMGSSTGQPGLMTTSEPRVCRGRTWFVATIGNDSNPGIQPLPLRTIQAAVDRAQAGDIIYVREGEYYESVAITGSGTETCPMTVTGYPDERPIIDGGYSLPDGQDGGCDPKTGNCFNWNPLVSLEGSYIVFNGFEVRESKGRGIRIWPGDHNTVRDCWVHDNRASGILVYRSEHHTIEYNRVWLSGDYAPYPRPARELNWPGALALRAGHHSIIRGNEVFNNWGEGIMPMETHDILIEDNTVYDNFAVNIYLATVGSPTIQRNLVYSTNSEPFLRNGQPCSGIVFATESGATGDVAGNQIVVNNILVGNGQNLAWWGRGRSGALVNALIANNTMVNAVTNDGSAINLSINPTPAHENVRIENNIILQDAAGSVAQVPPGSAFSFANNLWSDVPPHHASGSGDVVGDPKLVNPNAELVPGAVEAGWYKLGPGSPAVGGALPNGLVEVDFFGSSRDPEPDVGAHELE